MEGDPAGASNRISVKGVFLVGKKHNCGCVLPVEIAVAPYVAGPCNGAVAGYGAGCQGAVAGYGGYPGAAGGVAGGFAGGCFAPLAACSQGVCIENGELLIAAVLLFLGLGLFNGNCHPGGIGQLLGAVKSLQ